MTNSGSRSNGLWLEDYARLAHDMPDDVAHALAQYRDALVVQGVVQERKDGDRKPSWRLRFRARKKDEGLCRHLSVSLGSDRALVDRVEKVLEQFRAERLAQKVEVKAKQGNDKLQRAKRRELRFMIGVAAGGSRRMKKQAWSDYLRAEKTGNPAVLLSFSQALPTIYKAQKDDQSSENRLW